MEEYVGNSHKSKENAEKKEERPVMEKANIGEVTVRERSGFSRMKDYFIQEDGNTIKSYIWDEILLPGIKNIAGNALYGILDSISDMGRTAVNMALWKDPKRYNSNSGKVKFSNGIGTIITNTAYNTMFGSDASERAQPSVGESRYKNEMLNYEEIIFATSGDANVVLEKMILTAEQYKYVTVMDMFAAIGKVVPYTYDNFGWDLSRITRADVIGVHGGYIIRLPRALPLDKK